MNSFCFKLVYLQKHLFSECDKQLRNSLRSIMATTKTGLWNLISFWKYVGNITILFSIRGSERSLITH